MRVAAAALGVVRASVLPVKSCPGEIEAEEVDDDAPGSFGGSRAIAPRQAAGSCTGGTDTRAALWRGAHGWTACPVRAGHCAASVAAAYTRQPAYSPSRCAHGASHAADPGTDGATADCIS